MVGEEVAIRNNHQQIICLRIATSSPATLIIFVIPSDSEESPSLYLNFL